MASTKQIVDLRSRRELGLDDLLEVQKIHGSHLEARITRGQRASIYAQLQAQRIPIGKEIVSPMGSITFAVG